MKVLHEPYVDDFKATLKLEAKSADVIFIYRESAHQHMPLLRRLAPTTLSYSTPLICTSCAKSAQRQ